MATIADFANVAAATAAGYSLTIVKGPDGLQHVTLEIPTVGTFASGAPFRAHAEDASATTAKTRALAALNAGRKHKYAGAPGSPDGATVIAVPHGETHTKDKS
jgi:hypothetical protein